MTERREVVSKIHPVHILWTQNSNQSPQNIPLPVKKCESALGCNWGIIISIMSNFESSRAFSNENKERQLLNGYEKDRIEPDPTFAEIYSDYKKDMERVESLGQVYNSQSPEAQLGKVAEALVVSLLKKHEVNEHLQFRATSEYDDFFHGADVLVEPKNTLVQSVAALDITINQEDIKGRERKSGTLSEARPIGLENKLLRARRYTEYLAEFDPTHARDLSGWIESGGLHQPRNNKNESLFREAEKLFLMKYYKTPDTAPEPQKPGYVIGGPQTIISIDTLFINKALQGDHKAEKAIADLAVLEFALCIQAEQAHLDEKVRKDKSRNIFFDTHYAKVKAWSHVFEKPELESLVEDLVARNQDNREFREQLSYYANTFSRVLG